MTWHRPAMIGARVLIGLLFAAGAVQKIFDPGSASALLTGLHLPGWLVWPAMIFDAGAAVALFAGWRVTPVALTLAVYCGATSVFHLIPSDPWQMSIFVKNWAIAGGCLALAVAGGRET